MRKAQFFLNARIGASDIFVTQIIAPANAAIKKCKMLDPCFTTLKELIVDSGDDKWLVHPSLKLANGWYFNHSIVRYMGCAVGRAKAIVASCRTVQHMEDHATAVKCASEEVDALASKVNERHDV